MNQEAKKTSPANSITLNQASFLMSGITWQETLLQAYRNYMVITQSIFLAVSFVLFNANISANTVSEKLMYFIPFLIICALGLSTLRFLTKAVVERSKAVDWWQRRLLKHESTYSSNRHFSTFRVAKEHQFTPPLVEAHSLNEEEIEGLLRIETPRARKVFGVFVPGFYILWAVLAIISAINFPWKELISMILAL